MIQACDFKHTGGISTSAVFVGVRGSDTLENSPLTCEHHGLGSRTIIANTLEEVFLVIHEHQDPEARCAVLKWAGEFRLTSVTLSCQGNTASF